MAAAVTVRDASPLPKEIDACAALMKCNPRGGTPPQVIRVAVLSASYEGSESAMKEYDDLDVGPHHYINPNDDPNIKITVHQLKKATAYRDVRVLCKSGDYDVFFNLCDGTAEEDRAGFDVNKALEDCNVPFTGALAEVNEWSKPDQKMICYYNDILTPRFAHVESRAEAERKCPALRFPLIIKHPSGYSSVGLTKDCKVDNWEDLMARLDLFLAEYTRALIEEFIVGEEATVLVSADASCESGVRVFAPVCINFPEGEDFKHFDLKWLAFDDMIWKPVPTTHKAYQKLIDCGIKSHKHLLAGFGYGRVDCRIDAHGDVYFLECNTFPGIFYPPGQEASADWILKLTEGWDHRSFAILQLQEAIRAHEAKQPNFNRDFDHTRGYHLRAAKPILRGSVILHDEGRLQRLYTKPWVEKTWTPAEQLEFKKNAFPVGRDAHVYAVWETHPSTWFSFNHSCEPNMAYGPDRTLNIVASRDIDRGEELTMDYTTFMDRTCAEFDCHCGSKICKKRVQFRTKPSGLLQSPVSSTANSLPGSPKLTDSEGRSSTGSNESPEKFSENVVHA